MIDCDKAGSHCEALCQLPARDRVAQTPILRASGRRLWTGWACTEPSSW